MLLECLFHLSQNIVRKFKEFKIIKKAFTKRSYEILRNIEILFFIDHKQIKTQFNLIKEYYKEDNEKNLLLYYENFWLKKDYNLFNYSEIIKDILKIKNLYINKKGDKNSENILISKINSINKLFFTNNICENIHSKIAKFIPKGNVTKNNFQETIKYILNSYELNNKEIIRKDYITRTLIILIEKLKINIEPKIIT